MSEKKNKQPKTTLQKLNYWKRWNKGLTASEFAMPLIPFGIILGLNWNDWVGDSASKGTSLGLGFGMLVVAFIAAAIGIWKKDEIVSSKFSGIFYVAIVMGIVGFAFVLLAEIFFSLGWMFVYIAAGVLGSGTVAQVNKSYVSKKVIRYQALVKENGLDKKSAKELEDEEQAKKEGEQLKKERKVDLL